jgi:hypothetical protein
LVLIDEDPAPHLKVVAALSERGRNYGIILRPRLHPTRVSTAVAATVCGVDVAPDSETGKWTMMVDNRRKVDTLLWVQKASPRVASSIVSGIVIE